MSARLIKRDEQQAHAPYAPHTPPATAGSAATFLKTSQPKGPSSVTRGDGDDNAHALLPFRPRPASGLQPSQTAPMLAAQTLESTAPHNSVDVETASLATGQARMMAEQIVGEARERAAAIEHEARARGLADAEAIVTIEAAQAVEPLREKLAETIAEVSALRATIAARAEGDLVRLALEIAKKIIHREATMDREIALALARVALSRLHNRVAANIHLHPDDYNYVILHRDKLAAGMAVEIVEDRSIARGGCLVSTEMGDVDARIEQQFAEIERGFFGLT